jgi:hypothetical protein
MMPLMARGRRPVVAMTLTSVRDPPLSNLSPSAWHCLVRSALEALVCRRRVAVALTSLDREWLAGHRSYINLLRPKGRFVVLRLSPDGAEACRSTFFAAFPRLGANGLSLVRCVPGPCPGMCCGPVAG